MIWGLLRKREPQTLGPALLGKLPCQPDFVREGFRGAATDSLDAFLVEGTPTLHQSVGVSQLPTLLLYQSLPRQPHALIGVCAPSQDAAGRPFPVAIVHALAADPRRQVGLSELFWQYQEFVTQAEALVSRLPRLSLEEARAELDALTGVGVTAQDASVGNASTTVAPPAAAFERVVNGSPGAQSYALYTVASAFAAKHAGLTLDCPAQDAAQARLWLTLVAHVAEQTSSKTCILYAPHKGRLLIAIDAWHPGQLRAIADPSFSFDQLWPISTEHQEARTHAQSALSKAGPALQRPRGASVRELAEQLAHFSQQLRA